MKISIRKKLLFLAFLILAGIGYIGNAVHKSSKKIVDAARWVQYKEHIINQSEYIRSLGKDVEIASGGYILSADSSFLEQLHAAEKNVFISIRKLSELTRDNPSQQQRIDSLNFYMHNRLSFSLQSIELRKRQGLASAINYISTGQGRNYTDQIQKISNDIQQQERSLLEKQKKTNEKGAAFFNRLLVFMFVLMAVFTFLLLIITKTYLFQNKEKEERAAELAIAGHELLFQHEEKQKRAAELAIANSELIFQNNEKEKRAAELIVANEELAFQNEEKGKRALELIAANKELKTAEDDIRKLNEELEQKVIERTEQLESANKELESFSYSVSHDLRAPLRAVHGYAKMLKRSCETQLDTEANRLMDNIMNNAKKMGQLIDELLNFSRLGRKELVQTNIQMQDMVQNICDELKIEKDNRHITFSIHNILPAQGDSITIKQVWLNLISNAIKYSRLKDNPVIEISSEMKNNELIYQVKDNGAGFDMRYADKLFGVFQRLHSDDEFEGIGVGLAIVHRIITKHGGRVWAAGKVNEGAIFYFTLNI